MIWRVSSSGRTCRRPPRRRASTTPWPASWPACCGVPRAASWEAGDFWRGAMLAMLLHDACHSIDSPNVGCILENIKFPNYSSRLGRASKSHQETPPPPPLPTAFEMERPVPADDVVKDLLPAAPEPALASAPAPAARQ